MRGLAASRWALPSLEEFLNNHVQRLDASSLSPDDSCCHICQEDFETFTPTISSSTSATNLSLLDALPYPQFKDNGMDEPLLLPCNHIYGSACLQQWFACSGSSSCPMCARSLFTSTPTNLAASPELATGARYRAIRALPLRTLLTRPWNDTHIVRLTEDATELIGRLPRVLWKVAVRTLHKGGQEFANPVGLFEMYDDDATNLYTFFDRHVYMLDDVDEVDNSRCVSRQPFAEFLLSDQAGVQYARVCRALRRVAGQTMSAQQLYDELLAGEEMSRVVRLAVRALVDMQQQISDFVADCEASEEELST
ncbi:hypothetical protein K505DRAFT_390415 [Melanomma pulvis-pyrius CBS 109.77]|uniref:RING-type domain-containing protein n=1 Tax=Melanomma pulvis-pyrius CBS 109.77 TaxID=1314802 RepID=A0A6A6X3M6_9PLEO|nr:hypothetical protein K505DRAFT_390415 [Melanomma pulvis-pyrius CBS 109.77]